MTHFTLRNNVLLVPKNIKRFVILFIKLSFILHCTNSMNLKLMCSNCVNTIISFIIWKNKCLQYSNVLFVSKEWYKFTLVNRHRNVTTNTKNKMYSSNMHFNRTYMLIYYVRCLCWRVPQFASRRQDVSSGIVTDLDLQTPIAISHARHYFEWYAGANNETSIVSFFTQAK